VNVASSGSAVSVAELIRVLRDGIPHPRDEVMKYMEFRAALHMLVTRREAGSLQVGEQDMLLHSLPEVDEQLQRELKSPNLDIAQRANIRVAVDRLMDRYKV